MHASYSGAPRAQPFWPSSSGRLQGSTRPSPLIERIYIKGGVYAIRCGGSIAYPLQRGVHLVKLKGLMGRNLIFRSLHSPTESEEGDEAKRDDFWDGVYEIGCKERDIILLGMDNNGETREREVSDEEVNEEEGEEKDDIIRGGLGQQHSSQRSERGGEVDNITLYR